MLRHLARWWVWPVAATGLLAAEWLRSPGWTMAGLVAAAAMVGALATLSGRPPARRVLGLLLPAIALGVALAQQGLSGIELRWPGEREARIDAASDALQRELHNAFHTVERLAESAAATGDVPRAVAFRELAGALPRTGPETGVALLAPDGSPWAWAGRHRLIPPAQGDSLSAQANGYYVVLEARRHSVGGRIAVASLLVWAHPAVPEHARSLAALFEERHQAGLAVYPAGGAPPGTDVFDYQVPTTAGPRLLFSVRPIPPEQGIAKELFLAGSARIVLWLLLAVVVVGLTAADRRSERAALLFLLLWVAVRTPIGPALRLEHLFSKATFFRPELGALSASAGALGITGVVATILAVWLWRRRLERRWWGVALGTGLLAIEPYLVSLLARGITPPAGGVAPGLWLTWQLTLVVTVSGVIALSAALFRGARPERQPRWRVIVGVLIAAAAAVIGVFVWRPGIGWPAWYPFLWMPTLLLVTLPAPRWSAIIGIAIAAGSAAALVTWGAELTGRIQVAQRDIARLGAEADPLALPLLERFADGLRGESPPADATALYLRWHGSDLGRENYPVDLALWTPDGVLRTDLALDSLDLPAPLLASLVRGLGPTRPRAITHLVRVPGVHYILAARLDSSTVLTAAVGPRTELIPPAAMGRLLDPARRGSPLYQLMLTPQSFAPETPAPRGWHREGWQLRADRVLALPGGPRVVTATVDLRGPVPLLVRGALVVLLDVIALALLWYLSELLDGARFRRPHWRHLGRSFRIRLAGALAVFFLVPALGFAGWTFARLSTEAQRSRDLLIAESLQDATPDAAGLIGAPAPRLSGDLELLSRRVGAELALYGGGRLAGVSAPILTDLGVLGPLMDPPAYRALAFQGDLQLTREGPNPGLPERVGYQVIRPPPDPVVLATPQLADVSGLASTQLDLALVVLLATLVGFGAALAGAQAAARALSRPVAELRRAALALGQGRPLPAPAHQPPVEFEPVFGAFARMAADVRASQAALEEARRRTATVLGTVATGVIGLDHEGRVLIANPQAVALIGTALPEGASLGDTLPAAWAPLRAAAARFLSDPVTAEDDTELSVGGRRITLRIASLGPNLRGAVLALSDVTDLSRAERVLAWGEMARQVAHEIKNPLTPMRLGMQHLLRVWRERPERLGGMLEETSARILAEIDRLDTIARAFSRFAAPAEEMTQPLDRIDLAETAREVLELYRLTDQGASVMLEAPLPAWGAARRDELKEVLLNLLENARNAEARRIVVRVMEGRLEVEDDGKGIPPALLPRIFEPRFSTTTSGSGLGLPIVRRLVESWGGTVDVASRLGEGTRVVVRLTGE